eukprot:6568451-Prymnesium_polylepis.2
MWRMLLQCTARRVRDGPELCEFCTPKQGRHSQGLRTRLHWTLRVAAYLLYIRQPECPDADAAIRFFRTRCSLQSRLLEE